MVDMTDSEGNPLPEIPEPTRMNREEMIALAKDIVAGRVFGSWMIEDGNTPAHMLFMVLGLAGMHPKTGAVYEYIHKAGPRGINGYPSFFSHNVIHQDDLEEMNECLKKISEALDNVE